jgi:two-component system chemotaxis sensor kinase CheA
VIEVADDGAGLDREKILARAIERGLVEAGAQLDDAAISRAPDGAGLLDRRRRHQRLGPRHGHGRGQTQHRGDARQHRHRSTAGEGTKVIIRLPLTLAIIDGFLVGVGRSTYVVPLDMVVECMELSAEERAAIRGRSFINLRDKVLPLLRLRDAFEVEGDAGGAKTSWSSPAGAARRASWSTPCRRIPDRHQAARPDLRASRGISGSTILGTGRRGPDPRRPGPRAARDRD